jgi:DNA-binding FrmR family transcriptional regulator
VKNLKEDTYGTEYEKGEEETGAIPSMPKLEKKTLEKIYERQLRNALHDIKTLRRVEGELDAIEAELEKGIREKTLDAGYIYEKTRAVKKSMEYIERMVLRDQS